MAWVVQSQSEGPLILNDIGITLLKGNMRDLDLIGRENAERSNDIKLALLKGWIRTIRKDAHSGSDGGMSAQQVQQLQDATTKATEAANAAIAVAQQQSQMVEDLKKRNSTLEAQFIEQKNQNAQILAEVKAFADSRPIDIKTIIEAIRNAQGERVIVAEERKELHATDGMTEAELKARDKILNLKDKKLEKNIENLGKTISTSAEDVTDSLDALDQLGIG